MMYWSSGALEATSTASDVVCRRPARPARCQVEAIVAGVSRHHDDIERADVDAQLQRVRGHHRPDASIPQLPLDLAALPRKVAAAITPHGPGAERATLEGVFQVRDEHLGRQPVVGENQRLLVAAR